MLDRGMLKPLLKQAKLAHCKPLALRIWAISDQLGSRLNGSDQFLLARAVNEGGKFEHVPCLLVGRDTIARQG